MGAPIRQNISLPFLLLLKLADKLPDLFPFFTRLSNFCLILKCKAETYLKPERGQRKIDHKIHIYAAADFQAQKVKAWKVWAELEQIFSSSAVWFVFKRKLLALWTKEFSSPSSQEGRWGYSWWSEGACVWSSTVLEAQVSSDNCGEHFWPRLQILQPLPSFRSCPPFLLAETQNYFNLRLFTKGRDWKKLKSLRYFPLGVTRMIK